MTTDPQLAVELYFAATNEIIGTQGNDTLWGTGQNDRIVARAGNDTILAGNGNDYIIGGEGTDTMWGGGGVDVFSFGLDSMYGDRIKDFGVAWDYINIGDQIGAFEDDLVFQNTGGNHWQVTLIGVPQFLVYVDVSGGGVLTEANFIFGGP